MRSQNSSNTCTSCLHNAIAKIVTFFIYLLPIIVYKVGGSLVCRRFYDKYNDYK